MIDLSELNLFQFLKRPEEKKEKKSKKVRTLLRSNSGVSHSSLNSDASNITGLSQMTGVTGLTSILKQSPEKVNQDKNKCLDQISEDPTHEDYLNEEVRGLEEMRIQKEIE